MSSMEARDRLHGLVLWCDSDVRVERSAGVLKEVGLEVRAFSETDDLFAVYGEQLQAGARVSAVISSMMESGGRKEKGLMNAYGLFAKCREAAYAHQFACPPVFAIISSSADREASFAAGADVVVLGRRDRVQQLVLAKLRHQRDLRERWAELRPRVLWCDAADVSQMAGKFAQDESDLGDLALETFTGTEDMIGSLKQNPKNVVAIISSTMESGGRKEKGLLNGFAGFAKARELLEDEPVRPVFALVSGSAKTETCYAKGADLAICRDNAARRNRKMWDWVAEDVRSSLTIQLAGKPSRDMPAISTALLACPSYWESAGEDFCEMLPVNDAALQAAIQKALHDTFKRGKDGTAVVTRDRCNGEKPKDFKLVSVYRIEDSHMWRRYASCRHEFGKCEAFIDSSGPGGPVKTAQILGLPTLAADSNESYLWHGTSPEAAQGIIHSGFRIDLAGTAAGCAFGRGAYLAESSTKSDEYAKNGQGIFSQQYAMLLCRVALGPVVRVEGFYHEDSKTKRIVDEDIIAKKLYGCLLGDREACKGTYREFIVFRQEQIYPEFVVLYHRLC